MLELLTPPPFIDERVDFVTYQAIYKPDLNLEWCILPVIPNDLELAWAHGPPEKMIGHSRQAIIARINNNPNIKTSSCFLLMATP